MRKPANDNNPTASGTDNDEPNDNDEDRKKNREGAEERKGGRERRRKQAQHAEAVAGKHRLTEYERISQKTNKQGTVLSSTEFGHARCDTMLEMRM